MVLNLARFKDSKTFIVISTQSQSYFSGSNALYEEMIHRLGEKVVSTLEELKNQEYSVQGRIGRGIEIL